MHDIQRKFEKRGPLYVPEYEYIRRPIPGERYDRYRRRYPRPLAAITYTVGSSSTNSSASATISFSATAGGETIFVSTGPLSTAGQAYSITDSGTQSYTALTNLSVQTTAGVNQSLAWYKPNSASGITSVTVNNNGGADFIMYAYVISGVISASLDINTGSSNQVGSVNHALSTASGTLSQASEFVIASVGGSNGASYAVSQISAVGSPWTLDKYISNGAGNFNHAVASQVVAATTSVQANFTTAITAYLYWSYIISFKGAAGATFQPDEDYSATGTAIPLPGYNVTVY